MEGLVCFEGTPGKSRLPFSVRVWLVCYLWLHNDALTPTGEFAIATTIDLMVNPLWTDQERFPTPWLPKMSPVVHCPWFSSLVLQL